MPRIAPWLFRRARRLSPNLAVLLPACKDIQSAQNEFRWIKSHVEEHTPNLTGRDVRLAELCRRRGRGEPLQYVLGSQPFGSLDIQCRPGVLVPRSETEAYTCHLSDLIKSRFALKSQSRPSQNELNIVDFCTGTGCIPLQLFASLQPKFANLHAHGVDISPTAVGLARLNYSLNLQSGRIRPPTLGQKFTISKADVFKDEIIAKLREIRWDIMTSNPPYVSEDAWNYGRGQLEYSVRKFEPRLALVPQPSMKRSYPGWRDEDVCYARLLDIAEALKPKLVLLEVGDESQAVQVLAHFGRHPLRQLCNVEVWRDWPDIEASEGESTHLDITSPEGQSWTVPVKGSGEIRSILIQIIPV